MKSLLIKKLSFWTTLWFIAYILLWFVTQLSAQDIPQNRWINHCGDGVLRADLGEQCDDGNYLNGDGCSSNCEDETMVKSNTSLQEKVLPKSINQTTTYKVFVMWQPEPKYITTTMTAREVCDAWAENGAVCEPGYGGKCTYCTETCDLVTIVWSVCGDGRVDFEFEQCDDGNTVNDDWCSTVCKKENRVVVNVESPQVVQGEPLALPQPVIQVQVVEWVKKPLPAPTQIQTPPAPTKTVQIIEWVKKPLPAPTQVVAPVVVEQIVDITPPAQTVQETKQPMTITPLVLSVPTPVLAYCGDGVRQTWEQCDDGNLTSGDGCSALCHLEQMKNTLSPQVTPTRVATRDQQVLRSTPSGEWIWYTQPYPDGWLSETWSYLPIIHLQTIYLFLSVMIWWVWALLFRTKEIY